LSKIGETERSIDDKGRIVIPPEIRSSLGENCVLTRGYDKCINLFSQAAYDKLIDQMQDPTGMDRRVGKLIRRFTGTPVTIDGQGRLPISPALREYAEISIDPKNELKGVIIFSAINKLEIWSKERWLKYNDEVSDDDIEEALEIVIPRAKQSAEKPVETSEADDQTS